MSCHGTIMMQHYITFEHFTDFLWAGALSSFSSFFDLFLFDFLIDYWQRSTIECLFTFSWKNIFIKNSSNSISTEEIFCTGGKHVQLWNSTENNQFSENQGTLFASDWQTSRGQNIFNQSSMKQFARGQRRKRMESNSQSCASSLSLQFFHIRVC